MAAAAAAAAASNFIDGQRDLRILSVRTFSSSASVSSAIDTSNGRFLNDGFRLKGCCSENYGGVLRNNNDIKNDPGSGNEWQKARACFPSLTRVSEEAFMVEDQIKSPHSWDVNVLDNFVSALNQFIADHYSLNHSISEYHVYKFCKIWNCSRDEADIRVHEFFMTPYFKKGIYPIPGAQKALQKLSKFCDLSIVTSRQNAIKDHTIKWIEKHYPGLFPEIHFGNHFALDGQSRPKSDICKSLGAKVLIDDNPTYAIECAEVGIKVLLFDYENSYPWCKTDYICQHPLVTKVHNWEEVEHQLAAWILSE